MKTIKLLDGTVIDNVKLTINFMLDFDESKGDSVEIQIDGWIVGVDGWYSNIVQLEDLSSLFCENDLVRVKFILAKMNGALRIK